MAEEGLRWSEEACAHSRAWIRGWGGGMERRGLRMQHTAAGNTRPRANASDHGVPSRLRPRLLVQHI